MNKKGAGALSWLLGVIFLAVIIGGVYMVTQSATTPGNTDVTACSDSTGALTVNAVDALQKGTSVSSPTITCGVDGGSVATSVTSGTTTFPVGSQLECLVSKSGYIDTSFTETMPCGGLVTEVGLYQSTSDNPKITIKDLDVSTSALTDNVAGGAVNASNINAGDVLNLKVEFQGTSLESSGDGIYVIELPANSNANITSGDSGVTLGNLPHVSVPSVHTSQNAGSRIDAFEVPAIVGSEVKTYDLLISTQASKDLSGGVYTDWYAKQAFIDTDGTIKVGVEDSTGTAKYVNNLDYDFLIASS